MNRTVRILAALLALAALMGAESCVRSNKPPWERGCRGEDCRTAYIVTDGTGPYTLTIHVIEVGTDRFERTGPEPVAAGRFEANVTYGPGWALEITVELGGRMDDTFSCEIVDGPDNVERRQANGAVACLLVTRQ